MPKQAKVLNPGDRGNVDGNFVLVDVAVLLLPLAPGIKGPVGAGVTRFQRLGECIDVLKTVGGVWGGRDLAEGCIEVNRVALAILPGKAKRAEHG